MLYSTLANTLSSSSNPISSDIAYEVLTLINVHETEINNNKDNNDNNLNTDANDNNHDYNNSMMNNKKDADEVLRNCMDWLCDRKQEVRVQSDIWLKS
jgi:hypothetical protein